jgi:ribosome-associated translation inhibitor RaiA
MLVQVNTDNHVTLDDELAGRVEGEMEKNLKRFSAQITRVEVHLHDENGDKAGSTDKRCLLEVRVRGLEPFAVSHHAPSIAEAVKGATDKLVRSLDRTMAKLRHPKGRDPFETEVTP